MPEIKHHFTGGKMNKDLDERLVPDGEYRDAMNIQVATSEGSDVGTAQNVLGNEEIVLANNTGIPLPVGGDAIVIGAVSDEKVDTMYYLVWTPSSCFILSYNGDESTVVFRDEDNSVLKFASDMIITGINVIDDMLFWTDNVNEPRKINIQRCIDGTMGSNATKLLNNSTGSLTDIEEKHITVIKKAPQVAPRMQLKTHRDPDKVYTAVMEISLTDDGTSSFTHFSITGAGTHNFNTFSTVAGENRFAVEIKSGIDSSGNEISFPTSTNTTGNNLNDLTGVNGFNDLVGKAVVLQAFDFDENTSTQDPPGVPLTDFVMKGYIDDAGNDVLYITLTSIDGFPEVASGTANLKYVIDLYDPQDKLFEFKYPRFSYRYKFEDGEYSAFAPFTQVAFSPGAFDYHPRKGYNIGMTNRLSGVDLFDIVTEQTPADVVSIDILFKDDASPSVYVVDTIKPNDYHNNGTQNNVWNKMLTASTNLNFDAVGFTIERETISSIIPSNQLLRPWDNVPKKALAQDITGNRIVYANYFQNYDLETRAGDKFVPEFLVDAFDDTFDDTNMSFFAQNNSQATKAFKSIKSLREYQLGVVFLDEHGRETPVLSNATAIVKYSKKHGDKANRLGVKFSSDDYPQSLSHFKFFIKETSTEYYNMAMDRWYSAGDGNIWLAFPSSDRNKLDIDTFLILKKGSDSDDLVKEEARYKVLAIENEAPDFIKTTKRKAATVKHSVSGDNLFSAIDDNAPMEGRDEFDMRYGPFISSSGSDLAGATEELWVEFGHTSTDVISERYKIVSITNNYDSTVNTSAASSKYKVKLAKNLGDDVNFITDDPLGVSQTKIEDGAIVNIYKYKVENSAKFDGKFFVKIYFDEVFRKNIETSTTGGGQRIISKKKVYSMEPDLVETHTHGVGNFLLGNTDAARLKANYQHPITGLTWNAGANGIGNTKNINIYGYYNIHEFTANAIYFRKYRTIPYDDEDKIGKEPQNGFIGLGGLLNITDAKKFLNDNNFEALVHLKSSPTAGSVEYQGDHFKDADEWWKEFGYKTHNQSMVNKFSYDRDWAERGRSVTASWKHKHKNHGLGFDWEWYEEGYTDSDYKSDRDSARDNEVWFVDKGPIEGYSINTNDDLESFPWSKHPTPVTGKGITTWGSQWRVYLGFGGLIGHKPGFDNANNTGKGFWRVGNWSNLTNLPANPDYLDASTVAFAGSLETGSTFRWKEDPAEQEYVINGGVVGHNERRHSHGKHDLNVLGNPQVYNAQSSYHLSPTSSTFSQGVNFPLKTSMGSNLDSMAENLSFNNTKTFRINDITPALGWDPVAPGVIPNGLKVELKAVNVASNLVVTGSTSVWVDLVIAVDTLTDGTKKLAKGMALTRYESSGSAINPSNLAVRDIVPIGSKFLLYLGGWERPLTTAHHTELFITSKPDLNEDYTFEQVGMNGYSPNSEFNMNTVGRKRGLGAICAVGYTMEFIEEIQPIEILSDNPAIWETEPKESTELDIYYEASGAIPALVNDKTVGGAFPVGTKLVNLSNNFVVVGHEGENVIVMNPDSPTTSPAQGVSLFNRPDDLIIEADVTFVDNGPGTNQWKISIEENLVGNKFVLPWHNCYSFGNGVESNRIRDNFNLPYISNGVKASTTLEQEYEEEHRKYGLIYSGIYNSTSGINNLNQFIAGEKITKDVNPVYGSIQKLYSRDSDLVALCEDKILRISANKDALYNADGNPQLIATDRVLGQTIPFAGEYGISTNPESFAEESYRAYFTDRVRGAVMRLSKDGLTPISDAGMKDWFRDNLKENKKLIGSYDDRNNEYNILLTNSTFFSAKTFITGATQKHVPGSGLPPTTPSQASIWFSEPDWFKYSFSNSVAIGDGVTLNDPSSNAPLLPIGTIITSIDTGIPLTFGTQSVTQFWVRIGISDEIVNQTTGLEPLKDIWGAYPEQGPIDGGFMKFPTPLKAGFKLQSSVEPSLLSFSEKVGGWVSFKSYTNMQHGISLANNYYTFDEGRLYLHYSESEDRNTFYGVFKPSSLDVILNNDPSMVKVFNTLNYEGSQSKVERFTTELQKQIPLQPNTDYSDQQPHNLSSKPGWSVESIITNKEEGCVKEFLEKDGKWYNSINRNIDLSVSADSGDFTFQGVGVVGGVVNSGGGCMDRDASNFDPLATYDDGSCISPVQTSCDGTAIFYTNSTGGVVFGATLGSYGLWRMDIELPNGNTALSRGAGAIGMTPGYDDGTVDHSSLYPQAGPNGFIEAMVVSNGATLPYTLVAVFSWWNAKTKAWECTEEKQAVVGGTSNPAIKGCTHPAAINYNPAATVDDGSCVWRPIRLIQDK